MPGVKPFLNVSLHWGRSRLIIFAGDTEDQVFGYDTGMVTIEANVPFIEPPAWAVLERSLIDLMNDAVDPVMERYVRTDGSLMWPTTEPFTSIDGLDDAYESFHNWPVLYLLGGADRLLELSHRQYDAITRQFARYDSGHGHPMVVKEYEQGYDWMHQSEGYLFFYNLCLADPGNANNVERARRYAGFYLNEDPDAINYDPDKKLILCAHTGSKGPRPQNFEKYLRSYGYEQWRPWPLPFLDIEGIDSVEDLRKPGMAERMGAAVVKRVSRGDAACNLAATTMITNAYLCSGDEKYKVWVKEYVDAWIERAARNGGILPDNVGLSGEIGEYIDGKWYGGLYGWTWPHGWHNLGDACISAAENATLLCGDLGYMGFPRSQIDVMMRHGEVRGNTLHIPQRHNDDGWVGFGPLRGDSMAHIWSASMAAADLERIDQLRNHEAGDYARVVSHFSKHGGGHEAAWIAYLRGEYPDYPVDILRHNHAQVYQRLDFMRHDQQDPATYSDAYLQLRNPVTVEGLIQLTMGGPLFMYNGGLLMVRLRYFDRQRQRPGLPADVAALVEKLEDRRAVLHLVNLSATEDRELIVQAGAFGEHRFTRASYQRRRAPVGAEAGPDCTHEAEYREIQQGQVEDSEVEVKANRFAVRLEPGAQVRLDLVMERFVEDPSYALPWD